MSKVIMFSGKARSGKDTCAALLESTLHASGVTTSKLAFAAPLKETLASAMGKPLDMFLDGPEREEAADFYFDVNWVRSALRSLFMKDETPMCVRSTSSCAAEAMTKTFANILRAKASDVHDSSTKYDSFHFKASPRQLLQWFGTDLIRQHVHQNLWTEMMKNLMITQWEGNPDIVHIVTDCRFENEAQLCAQFGGTVISVYNPSGEAEVNSHTSEAGLPNNCIDIHLENNHELGLGKVTEKIREVANILGLIPHALPCMDYRGADLKLLPTSIIQERLSVAKGNLSALYEALTTEKNHPKLVESLQDDIHDVTKIVIGLTVELNSRK